MSGEPNRIFFNTGAFPQRDRFPLFCEELTRRYSGLDVTTQVPMQFHAVLELQRIGAVDIGFNCTSQLACIRTPAFIGDGDDGLRLTLLESGTVRCTQGRTESLAGSGEAVIADCGYTGVMNFFSDARHWYIKVPRAELSSRLPPGIRFSGAKLDRDPLARRLLFGYLRGTRPVDLSSSGRAAALFDAHVIDLVVLALGAEGEAGRLASERGARHARREAILREIRSRSHDHTLSVVEMALKFGITPRYVHLLLEETGKSFSRHVLERRLEKAAALLRDARSGDLKIVDIALKAGFNDLSYFNRVFRRHYGMSPRDAREAARQARAKNAKPHENE